MGRTCRRKNATTLWLFDPFHHNTLGYESGMPWDAATHVPNAPNGNSFDIDNPPDQKWEFNLGNFGVTNRYYLTVSNIDSKKRTLNYVLDTSLTSSIVIGARRIWANAQPIYTYAHRPVCAL